MNPTMKIHELISYLESLHLPDMEVIADNHVLVPDDIWVCHVFNSEGHYRLHDPQMAELMVLSIGDPNPMSARDAELLSSIGGEGSVRYAEICRHYGVRHETQEEADAFLEKVKTDPPIKILTTEM
jgi:hypothetical protein